MKLKKMMLGLNLVILPIVSITIIISCNSYNKKPVKEVVKTIEDLQTAIANKANDIKIALNGKTSEMTIDKIKKTLNDNIGAKFSNLIENLIMVDTPKDGSVIVTLNSTKIILITSTNTPNKYKRTYELKSEIIDNEAYIEVALTGKTSEMTIDKVKKALNDNVDQNFADLIENLIMVGKPKDGSVIVALNSFQITIKTSTATPTVLTLLDKFKDAMVINENAIQASLIGKTSEMTIDKVKKVLNDNVGEKFSDLIENLIMVGKPKDGSVIVALNSFQITIKTSTYGPIKEMTVEEFKLAIKEKEEKIQFDIVGDVSGVNIVYIKIILKKYLNDCFDALINGLILKSKKDLEVTVLSGITEIIIKTYARRH